MIGNRHFKCHAEDNYNLGVAIAYLLRAGKKPFNPIEDDIQKAIVHLQRELRHQLSKHPEGGYVDNEL